MRIALFVIALLLAPMLATAGDVAAKEVDVNNGCKWVKLCEAEASATGKCGRGSDDIIALFQRDYSHTLYGDQSSSTFSGTLCSGSTGTTTTCGATNPVITITNANNVVPFDGVLSSYWIELSANAGLVTIWDYACPLGIGS